MNYTVDVTINAPFDNVVELFSNHENITKWQVWLESAELYSGELGKKGAKTKMIYDINGRKTPLIETIISDELPQNFVAKYEGNGATTINKISFLPQENQRTLFRTETTFEAGRFTVKMLSFLVPSLFRKQTKIIAEQFKVFAEKEAQLVPIQTQK